MHVTLVSQCEKRALKRTRALIDRYAIRISDRSWSTPITKEALDDLRLALRRNATRQTAIACYINKGRHAMKLAWTIGRPDAFGLDGALAVGTQRRPRPAPPPWLRTISLVAKTAGLAHDLGKGSVHFQNKLASAVQNANAEPIKDETRHEWVSMKLYQSMRENGFDWQQSWARINADSRKRNMPFDDGERAISSVLEAVDFAVLTHHQMLAPKQQKICPAATEPDNHTSREGGIGGDDAFRSKSESFANEILLALQKTTKRLNEISAEHSQTPEYCRAITLLSRAALILADHEISANTNNAKNIKPAASTLWANTRQVTGKAGKLLREFNQPLKWHLENVANRAQFTAHLFDDHRLPGLSQQTIDAIRSPSVNEHFQWQNVASAHFEQEEAFCPTLIFNMAGTGAGKTRMNVRAIATLRGKDEPLRIAAGFNLRTLTLQTHKSFRDQMQMGDEEVACVIGERSAIQTTVPDTDENLTEEEIDYETSDRYPLDYPDWLNELSERHPELINLIGAPVLVSTMDYLVAAGDPSKQGHHVHALLRIASSDLILDEVDSYGPESLVAVLRVAQMSGLFGRHIIASSATLCEPVANALFDAWLSGIKMYAALRNEPVNARISMIDNALPPTSFLATDMQNFKTQYQNRIHALVGAIQNAPVYRKNLFCEMPGNGSKDDAFDTFFQSIRNSIHTLHKNQSWKYGNSGKRVSFGLVRVANVRPCVKLAAALNEDPHLHVTAYHAVDIRERRTRKEMELDKLFNRAGENGNAALLIDPDIQKRIEETEGNDVIFVIVATPVEEIGRDHDFDWAVIEPSSTQSIVQTAGRVNRHRLIEMNQPNVSILQYNLRALEHKEKVFCHPGNQVGDINYRTSDVITLIGKATERIDASLRFGLSQDSKCDFARLDDKSIQSVLEKPVDHLVDMKSLAWASKCQYDRYPLREKNIKRRLRIAFNDAGRLVVLQENEGIWIETADVAIADEKPSKPFWLSPDINEMLQTSDSSASSMEFEINDNAWKCRFDQWIGGY